MDQWSGRTDDGSGLNCEFCGKTFTSMAVMMEHRRIHTGERPYGCVICNKRFTQKAHLIIHKRTHTGEKPYACHICHKRFAQSSHLTTHKRVHTGEKPYFCPICNAGYSRKQRLEAHMLQHAQEGLMGQEGAMIGVSSSDNSFSPFSALMESGLPTMVNPQVPLHDSFGMGSPSTASTHRRKPSVVKQLIHTRSQKEGSDLVNIDNETGDAIEGGSRKVKTEPQDIDTNGQEENETDDVLDNLNQSSLMEDESIPDGNRSTPEDKDKEVGSGIVSTSDMHHGSGDEGDAASVTSDSNLSSSEQSIPTTNQNRTMLSHPHNSSSRVTRYSQRSVNRITPNSTPELPAVRTNNRICLVDFTANDLTTHLLTRDDSYHCDFCCIIFQDAAMYHLHRSMHDKMDIRCCNLCGRLAQDKYDFLAHFLSEHK
ncbi:hypothetical protein ACJMK2_020457 [Sinanodonta woodiana]|uniref:C2H2-type domain-containing protein n=1 Tax=Sinanodonta woodiana TaxID=1069815 RepID=A0ABD3TXX3_SINWO